ncbi:hypothetical protein GCM10023195_39620 [Actinoallomurus liliacearum]|uniref:Uncharacterized protein n=1 Tax=Actinoallomurus liliacearum TaxID=1080073 RepID=A0ABP8TLC4_9ACTN
MTEAALGLGDGDVDDEPDAVPGGGFGAEAVDALPALREQSPPGRGEGPADAPPDPLGGEPAVGGRTGQRLPGGLLLDAELVEDLDKGRGPDRLLVPQDELPE